MFAMTATKNIYILSNSMTAAKQGKIDRDAMLDMVRDLAYKKGVPLNIIVDCMTSLRYNTHMLTFVRQMTKGDLLPEKDVSDDS